jgi:hypothetical protein
MEPLTAVRVRATLAEVELPADKATLLEHAVRVHAEPLQLAALRALPDLRCESVDEVVQQLRIQGGLAAGS